MIDILRKRRSVRNFLDKEVEEEKVQLLLEAVLRAPTSRDINPTEFILIKDKKMLQELSTVKAHGAGFLGNANIAIAVIGDTEKSDTCIEDCSIAAIIIQLTAESLNLGSCWAQIRLRKDRQNNLAEDNVRGLLNIPSHFLVECIIGIGYPANRPTPIKYEDLDKKRLHFERY
jgi:nitroreductase